MIVGEREGTAPKHLKEVARRMKVREVATLDVRGMAITR